MEKSTQFTRALIFVNNKFNGFYRYRNKFQIFPFDSSLQGVANLHIPLCIEFSYDLLDVEFDDRKPRQVCISDYESKLVKELLILLTVFTQYNFYSYDNDQCWFYPLPSNYGFENADENFGYNNNIESIWGQKTLMGKINEENITLHKSRFSEIDIDEIKTEESEDYFNVYGQRLNTDAVSFPENIDLYFDEYYKCSDEKRKTFISAASLFNSGLTLRDTKSHLSLSFASFISSIETLSVYDYKEVKVERCSECGLERYQVTKKFREFFIYYVNNEKGLLKYIDKMYSIRSKILHEGRLFLSDIAMSEFSDILEVEHLIRLIRISIVNWLLKSKQRFV